METEQLKKLASQFEREVSEVQSEEELFRVKSSYVGKKGHLALFFKKLAGLPVEDRPILGAEVNRLKLMIEDQCRSLQDRLDRQRWENRIREEAVDVTLPSRSLPEGRLHPLSQVLREVETIFQDIGFKVFEGPEIETDYYNFEALNVPADHPARDMQDTFYLSSPQTRQPLLLRTHTSPVQIHVMEKMKPPIRMIAPGVVYRRDSDVSHTPMFHQVEGLVVGEGIRFSDLKGVLTHFLHRLFGSQFPVRFRSSYFPFTEPSAEVDMRCKPCAVCKGSGWLEVMGCGMVHPAVFEKVKYDPDKMTGFAFGMGIERLTMIRHAIPDIRLFFENDLRFLSQF